MPIYVYRFIDSDETIEVQQSFSDATLTEYPHPDTGEIKPVKKVYLPVGVTFKGDGFYKTDSRSTKSASRPEGKKSSDSAKSESSGSSGSATTSASSSSSGSSSASSD